MPAADIFIVADRDRRLHLVERGAAGLTTRALQTIDATRSFGELAFDDVAGRAARSSKPASPACCDAGRVMLAADTLGAGWTMIDKAVAYAKERKQFGRIIASFQAVKHLCAEMAAAAGAGPRAGLVRRLRASISAPDEAPLMAAHAKAHLGEAGRFVARTATEVHGGIGITDMLGLHYWFKRIGANRPLLGSPERMREQAARIHGFVG